MLATLTLTNEAIALSVLGIVGALIGYHFVIGKYIRQQAGISENMKVELSPTNEVRVSMKVDSVTVDRFEKFESYVHERNHGFANELNGLRLTLEEHRDQDQDDRDELRTEIHAGFERLDSKRSVSIGGLHTQLKTAEVELSMVKAETKATQRVVDRLETKLDNVVDRVADKIQDLLKGRNS